MSALTNVWNNLVDKVESIEYEVQSYTFCDKYDKR